MRTLAAALLCVMPTLSGCASSGRCHGLVAQQVRQPELEQIVGVRVANGERAMFDGTGVVVMRDTIFTRAGGRLHAVPMADVRELWIRNPREQARAALFITCPNRARFGGPR